MFLICILLRKGAGCSAGVSVYVRPNSRGLSMMESDEGGGKQQQDGDSGGNEGDS